MARLLGVEIPDNKQIEYALPYIYGIGRSSASKIVAQAGIEPTKRAGELSTEEINLLIQVIGGSGLVIEGDLRRELSGNMKRLQQIQCYRGIRHRRGLPVRGQRTSTNARTRKGGRKTVGAVRKK